MRGNLKAERARRGLSAAQVGQAVGVNKNQVLRWEAAEVTPGGENLTKLAQFYGCDPAYLLEETDRERR